MPVAPSAALVTALAAARTARRWTYPWDGLEDEGDLRLIGYGSLINADSARRTISSEHRMPVLVAGARRVFNYVMDPLPDRYGPLDQPDHRSALNVRTTYRPDDLLNGVLTSVPRDEIPALRERERDYNLLPVPWVPWLAPDDPPVIAWILEAREARTAATVMPHREYYRLCRQGAESYGPAFLDFWLDSTFLADGVTSVRVWERAVGEVAD